MALSRRFWQTYVKGGFGRLSSFLSALAVERKAQDQTPDHAARFFGTIVDGIHFDAPERLRFTEHALSETGLKQATRADWQYVDPRFMAFIATLIETLRQKGIPMYAHNSFRDKEWQQRLFNKGRSKVVWPRAPHCLGCAVDVVHGKYHWELTPQEWALIGKIGKDIAKKFETKDFKIRWGGDFVVNGKPWPDPAHWEILTWREHVQELEAGPPLHLTPRAILRRGLPRAGIRFRKPV